jgi:hypothetical protein
MHAAAHTARTDNAPRHLAHELVLGGEEAGVGPAEAHGHTEPLRGADDWRPCFPDSTHTHTHTHTYTKPQQAPVAHHTASSCTCAQGRQPRGAAPPAIPHAQQPRGCWPLLHDRHVPPRTPRARRVPLTQHAPTSAPNSEGGRRTVRASRSLATTTLPPLACTFLVTSAESTHEAPETRQQQARAHATQQRT